MPAMRQLIAVAAFVLFVSPVLADDWKTYDNPRFGFTVEVPAEGALGRGLQRIAVAPA